MVVENLEAEPQRPPGRLQLQDMQLLGLDLSKGLLLVWDGERAEVGAGRVGPCSVLWGRGMGPGGAAAGVGRGARRGGCTASGALFCTVWDSTKAVVRGTARAAAGVAWRGRRGGCGAQGVAGVPPTCGGQTPERPIVTCRANAKLNVPARLRGRVCVRSPPPLETSFPPLQVYKVSDTNDIMAASQFETSSRCMAINNDSIYRAAEGKLEVVNMAGEGGEGRERRRRPNRLHLELEWHRVQEAVPLQSSNNAERAGVKSLLPLSPSPPPQAL